MKLALAKLFLAHIVLARPNRHTSGEHNPSCVNL